MTTRNRTERRLLDTIRKAKTEEGTEVLEPVAEIRRRRPTSKTAEAAKPTEGADRFGTGVPRDDPYQLGRRVWPD
jgi:hypothetical protein